MRNMEKMTCTFTHFALILTKYFFLFFYQLCIVTSNVYMRHYKESEYIKICILGNNMLHNIMKFKKTYFKVWNDICLNIKSYVFFVCVYFNICSPEDKKYFTVC